MVACQLPTFIGCSCVAGSGGFAAASMLVVRELDSQGGGDGMLVVEWCEARLIAEQDVESHDAGEWW